MRKKNQDEKKLSLKKQQMVKITNPRIIIGGGNNGILANPNLEMGDDNTGTVGTSRKD